MKLTEILKSFADAPGFNEELFLDYFNTGKSVVSIRKNPFKPHPLYFDGNQTQVPWCEEGIILTDRPQFIFDPMFHAGVYYVQEASSMFIATILKQIFFEEKGKFCIDLCASPGGKSTLISSFLGRDGFLLSNEAISGRVGPLLHNTAKWGLSNMVVTNNSAAEVGQSGLECDLLLVDAPCSGSGMFTKDEGAIEEWSMQNVQLCAERQHKILADALPVLTEGGFLIYSTCSYSVSENESVCDWLIEKHDLEPIKIDILQEWKIVESNTKSGAYTYRFYPYLLSGEGFFTSVFRKKAESRNTRSSVKTKLKPESKVPAQIKQAILPDGFQFYQTGSGQWYAIPSIWEQQFSLINSKLNVRTAGQKIGEIKGKDFVPDASLALSIIRSDSFEKISLTKEAAIKFLQKRDFGFENTGNGLKLIEYEDFGLGWAKKISSRWNNYFPASWMIRKES